MAGSGPVSYTHLRAHETEADVLNRLREHSGDLTVLLISQRISTVMRADRILCLENGTVKGFGSHEQLMKNCELYRTIIESQIGGGQNVR